MMERFGMEEGEALEHKWLNKSVETAQKRVEQRNYQWRKRVLDFDDVMNKQREIVYGYRNDVLNTEDPREEILEVIDQSIPAKVNEYMNERDDGRPDYTELLGWINETFPLRLTHDDMDWDNKSEEQVSEDLVQRITTAYELKAQHEDPDQLDGLERHIILVAIDRLWQQHLYSMDALREGVSLRSHGQKDPLVEYKNEAFKLFGDLMESIQGEAVGNLFKSTTNLENFENFLKELPQNFSGADDVPVAVNQGQIAESGSSSTLAENQVESADSGVKLNLPKRRPTVQIGRNDSCPCGSGKKYKQCCGRMA